MATVFLDSVEHYTASTMLDKWTTKSGTSTINTSVFPSEPPFIICGSSANSYVQITVPSDATYAVNFLWAPNGLTGSAQILSLYEGSTLHLDVRLITNVLRVTRNGTTLATGATTLANQGLHWISFLATINDTTGSFELRIDGNVEVSGSGVDTRNAGASGVVDSVRFGNIADKGSGNNLYRDIIINSGTGGNTGIVGQRRVRYLIPNAPGNQTDFTPSAGANWENVDEVTSDGDTTTNTSSTVSHKDLFNLSELPSVASSVYATQEVTRARKDDAGARTMRQVIRTGGTDYESASITLSTAHVTYLNVREANPGGGSWSTSDPSNLQAGYKVQA